MPLTAAERSARARLAAFSMHARNDPRETTLKARQTFLAQFAAEVDPDGVLPPAERARRAEAARKAHMARLTLMRLRTRSAKKKQTAESLASAVADEIATEVMSDASGQRPSE